MTPMPCEPTRQGSSGRAIVVVLLAVAVGAVAALVLLKLSIRPRVQIEPAKVLSRTPDSAPLPAVAPVAPEPLPPEAAPEPNPPQPAPPLSAKRASTAPAAQLPPKAGQKDPPPKDELARVALACVGIDPEAEAYWYSAINDQNLSAHERQDLIEDLNEEGFSDPRRPGPEELALILSRLSLIEEVAGDAMDQVNAEAFAEAYKDLVNMRNRLLGQ